MFLTKTLVSENVPASRKTQNLEKLPKTQERPKNCSKNIPMGTDTNTFYLKQQNYACFSPKPLAKGDRKTDDKPYNPSKRLREILVELIQCAMLGQSKKGKFKHTET